MYCTFKIEERSFEAEAPILPVEDQRAVLGVLVSNPGRVGSLLSRVWRSFFTKQEETETDEEGQPKPERHFSVLEKETAVVRAFEGILDEIIYIETTDKWHLVSNFSAFEAFIRQRPLKTRADKQLMSRMLVEMARLDGRISERERLFIDQFVNVESTRLANLMQAPALTADDCEEATEEGRPTIFLVVAAGALSDDRLKGEEERRLYAFAEWFGFDAQKRQHLLDMAQDYTLELAIRNRIHRLRPEQLEVLADEMGVSLEFAKEVYSRVKVIHDRST